MEQAKPAMKAEINLFRARDKNSRSNFAMNSALIRDISGRERLNFIDIILSFMCMGGTPAAAVGQGHMKKACPEQGNPTAKPSLPSSSDHILGRLPGLR
jgi:hypothetical protein